MSDITMLKYRLILITILLSHTSTLWADEITQPIINLFDAMRAHDADKIQAQFTEDAILQRAQPDGTVRSADITSFAKSVGNATSYLDEHLLSIEVNQSGNVASVWTPFAFYRDKQLSHCGINSFQLVETTSGWKIHYLIDNAHQGDCKEFIKRHKK